MSTGYEMKKEWMYFIAGAGLMAVILVALDAKKEGYSSADECILREMPKPFSFARLSVPLRAKEIAIYDYCFRKYPGEPSPQHLPQW